MTFFLIFFYALGFVLWLVYHGIEYDASWGSKRRKRHHAQMLFASPVWFVFLSVYAARALWNLYLVAFGPVRG